LRERQDMGGKGREKGSWGGATGVLMGRGRGGRKPGAIYRQGNAQGHITGCKKKRARKLTVARGDRNSDGNGKGRSEGRGGGWPVPAQGVFVERGGRSESGLGPTRGGGKSPPPWAWRGAKKHRVKELGAGGGCSRDQGALSKGSAGGAGPGGGEIGASGVANSSWWEGGEGWGNPSGPLQPRILPVQKAGGGVKGGGLFGDGRESPGVSGTRSGPGGTRAGNTSTRAGPRPRGTPRTREAGAPERGEGGRVHPRSFAGAGTGQGRVNSRPQPGTAKNGHARGRPSGGRGPPAGGGGVREGVQGCKVGGVGRQATVGPGGGARGVQSGTASGRSRRLVAHRAWARPGKGAGGAGRIQAATGGGQPATRGQRGPMAGHRPSVNGNLKGGPGSIRGDRNGGIYVCPGGNKTAPAAPPPLPLPCVLSKRAGGGADRGGNGRGKGRKEKRGKQGAGAPETQRITGE